MRKSKRHNDKCSYCGRSKRVDPCEQSDHGRLGLYMAMEDAARPVVSFGCENPLDRQAVVLVTPNMRRHPVTDEGRPENSGWCPDTNCACECHNWEEAVIDYTELEIV